MESGGTIPVGGSVVKGDYYHNCARDPKGGVRYSVLACKVSVHCEGPNIGQPIEGADSTKVEMKTTQDKSQVGQPQVTSVNSNTTIITTEERGTSTGTGMTSGKSVSILSLAYIRKEIYRRG